MFADVPLDNRTVARCAAVAAQALSSRFETSPRTKRSKISLRLIVL
jgi:hypothetical protein